MKDNNENKKYVMVIYYLLKIRLILLSLISVITLVIAIATDEGWGIFVLSLGLWYVNVLYKVVWSHKKTVGRLENGEKETDRKD